MEGIKIVRLGRLRFVIGGFSDVCNFIVSRMIRGTPGVYLPCSLYDFALMSKDDNWVHGYDTIDYCTTDGMPLVWFVRRFCAAPSNRIYGPNMVEFLLSTLPPAATHVFLVPSQITKKQLNKLLCDRFLEVKITHTRIVPKNHTSFNFARGLSFIMKNDAQVVFWIGIGSPNQVLLAKRLREAFPKATIFCVGAALNLLTGVKPMAPKLLQRLGLEWLFRLVVEPRRLWRRYLIDIPRFLFQAGFLFLRRLFWS